MIESTATGRPLGPRLLDLARATGTLTVRQARLVGGMLVELERLEGRKTALLRAVSCLPTEVAANRWQAALAIESGLRRVQGVAGRRVSAGHREPTPLEVALLDLLAQGGPASARKLWSEIRESRR
ncbi:MAG: hypothetical protein IPK63_23680 [Candidatus Competibacteraceae bacterium]|nr:hypothetical protein [Candidatus Competibacteraceae bacterium]